ncbi:MAG: HD domain-containing protein [Planctomycetes bacterium]|nr:HD domain-containing protein [Planctomycetota bacterium]
MKRFTRFGKNTFLWFLLVSLLPLTAVSVTTYFYMRAMVKDRALDDLESNAGRHRDHVQTFINAWLWRAADFSSDGFIRDASQEILLGTTNNPDIIKRLNTHLRTNKKSLHPDILEVFILNKAGIVIASSDDTNMDEDLSETDYFKEPLLHFEVTGGTFAGDIEPETSAAPPELCFSRVLKDKVYKSPIGVIVLRVKIRALQEIINPSALAFADGVPIAVLAKAYIINKDGWLIADSPLPGQDMLRYRIDTKGILQALSTRTDHVGEYENYLGTDVLGATLFIDKTDWVITTEVNARDVFAPLRRLGYIFGGIAGFAILLIFGLSFTITRGINKSIKELILGTERIASGDLDHKIEIRRKDELQTLSDSFNTMMHSLKTSNEERERLFSVVERAKVEWEKTFDSINDAILSCDADHNIVRANSGATRLLGVEMKDLIGTPCHKATLSLSGFELMVNEVYNSLKPSSGEVYDLERDKTFFASIYPIVDKGGLFRGCVQILRDISDIKKTEKELEERRIVAMTKLADLTEKRDPETGHHLARIRAYCQIIAEELRKQPKYSDMIDDTFISHLQDASMLHDIGKVGIPDSILSKPGSLSPEEFEIVKLHTVTGYDVLAGPEYFKMARETCRHHHERYDGKGYPDGLKGEDIPLAARIVSLADAYDAIVSDRPYRKARTHEQALAIILEESGKQFCHDVVKAFISRERDFHALVMAHAHDR